MKLTWYQGLDKPRIWKEQGIPQWASGHLFVGDKDAFIGYKKHVLLPEDKFEGFKGPDPFIPRSPNGHHQDWVDACKGGAPTMCDFEYSGLLTEANHLGNVAYRAGKKIEVGYERDVTNSRKAEQYVKRNTARAGGLVN